MTVASETNRSGPYSGNGVTTVFPYGFRILSDQHLRVIRTDAAGNETTLTLSTHYTVSGVGSSGGGSVTTLTAPATGETITILRDMPFTQETDLENQGAYYAETIEQALDLAAMRDQQLAEEMGRAIKLPASSDDPNGEISTALIASVSIVSGISDEVVDVAGVASSVQVLAGVSGDVAIVASNVDALTQVASALLLDEKVFTGNGVQTVFALNRAPGARENVLVWVGGAIQSIADYTVAGVSLTLSAAVPNGTKLRTLIIANASANEVSLMRDEVTVMRDEVAQFAIDIDTGGFYTKTEVDGFRTTDQNAAKNADNLNAGTVADARLPVRLQGGSSLSLASQAEAEAGTENTKAMTALRVKQAVAYQVATSAMRLLDTKVISGSPTAVDFTAFDASKYSAYVFQIDGVANAVGSQALAIRTSTNGGTSFDSGASDYKAGGTSIVSGGIGYPVGGSMAKLTDAGSNAPAANDEVSGELRLFRAGVAAKARGTTDLVHLQATGLWRTASSFSRESATAVNALRFMWDGGAAFSGGTIRMYGISKT